MRKENKQRCQDISKPYPNAGNPNVSSASGSVKNAFNDTFIRNALQKVRQDKRTIKDNFWLRPDNH